MRIFNEMSISAAHAAAIHHIIWNHREITTEDGEQTWESEPITLEIREPLTDMIHPLSSFQQQRCDEYTEQLLSYIPNDFDYTYHERLFEYYTQGLLVNQIYNAELKLKHNPQTRRALAITWEPYIDSRRQHVPCLQYVQFYIRYNKFDMVVLFRSEDMLTAAGPNMYALARLQQYLSKRLDTPIGTYTHIITIPHIYNIRDSADLARWF